MACNVVKQSEEIEKYTKTTTTKIIANKYVFGSNSQIAAQCSLQAALVRSWRQVFYAENAAVVVVIVNI